MSHSTQHSASAKAQRIVVRSPGGFDKLEIAPFEPRTPQAGEVAIDVRACGVNFADTAVRMGLYKSAKDLVGWPITPGFEVAGVVREVGAGVTHFSPGDSVVAVTQFGGYTSHINVVERQVFALPQGWSFEQGAAFPTVALTAYYALHELAHPRPGAKVLVHSAAGGVGGYLIQLCKAIGCYVVGVVSSSAKAEVARAAGADEVIDKSHSQLWDQAERFAPHGYDLILDANGVETLRHSYEHLRPAGKLVVYGFSTMLNRGGSGRRNWPKLAWSYLRTPRFNPLDLTIENRSVLAFNLSTLFERLEIYEEGVRYLLQLAKDGKLTPPSTAAYPLAEASRAHADIQSGNTTGKLVLIPQSK